MRYPRISDALPLRFLVRRFKRDNGVNRFRDDLEESGDFGVFWSLLSAELHRRIRCLDMDGDLPTVRLSSSFEKRYSSELAFQCCRSEVNQHPIAEVMPILLKSGQVCLARESCREEERMSIDARLLISIDMDDRMRAEHIL
ncbi:hypothetical protein F2Q68_00010707 [Brassica cretica]|uniref:Uncharacterized protein n=1 Tax=Brassica cretica TaxID=69181 RepID=A0A8S9KX43_BRACR|nr:hypothetical protein F2Q68_00010707 [Brassica cretica]